MLRPLAAELIAEIRHLDRRIAAATGDITAAVAASNSTLTELCGIADLTAGKILARVGDITRFPSAAALAAYTGTAQIEVSSDDRARSTFPGWDRQLNFCLHNHGDHPDPPRHPDELITSANARLGRATKKPCAV